MPYLDVEGASLYYETDGAADSPCLLLIHAGIASLRMWDPQIAALASDHFVVRLDMRGFGLTESQNIEFSNRADALAVLDHVGVHKATVIGCSRGGGIAIDLTLDSPGRVLGLVVIGSGPSGFPEVELTDREDELFDEVDAAWEAGDWIRQNRLEAALWDFGPERREEDLDPAFVATAYELNAINISHIAEQPIPIGLEPSAYGRVSDIEVPTLVMVGDFDITPALLQYEYLVTTIPHADGCRFPNAAHLPSVEQANEFERVLLDWLGTHGL
ncbi:alpha/beta fold hydrolase [Glaciihabitans sp. dw_435]|uniref:alpha/beta fold hydrolase n=1 Tax=Glaciihabitans sp. dw_435 TaxID=2720081 RepID=UPI001BD312A7|nr:alpha/beta fold hydrolase [Glaciihabitans sp. dw_435]